MATATDLSVYTAARNRTIDVDGVRLTYRDVGVESDEVPIVLLNHWGATLDNYDPLIVANLARKHRVVLTNYHGVGRSGGRVRTTIGAMSLDFLALLDALHIRRAHLFGFSLGGFVAQDVAVRAPQRVASLTLAGTGPAGGYKIGGWHLLTWFRLIFKSVFLLQEPRRYLFFSPTTQGKAHAKKFIDRTSTRKKQLDGTMSLIVMMIQAIAITRWGRLPAQDLKAELTMPVLIANGDNDLMVPTENSARLAQQLPHAKLLIYKNAGHGGIFQNADDFSANVLKTIESAEERSQNSKT